MSQTGNMVFQRLGGEYQLVIRDASDLAHVLTLGESHWLATDVAIESLICDPTFLKLVDNDANGRVRTDEMREAVAWLLNMLADRSRITNGVDSLALDAIDASHKEGQALQAAARRILGNLGLPDATEITLEQVRDRKKIMANAAANGDGVIPPEAADTPELAAFIADIAKTAGATDDASGLKGITAETLDAFLKDARDFLEWSTGGELAPGSESSDVLVWGAATAGAYAALEAVREKVAVSYTHLTLPTN